MALSPSVQKVQQALTAQGFAPEVCVLAASARTAPEAAQALGCALGQIIKCPQRDWLN